MPKSEASSDWGPRTLESRLTEIETRLTLKIDNLIEKFDAVNNGPGFPRCSERNVRLQTVEREINEVKRGLIKVSDELRTHCGDAVARSEFDELKKSFVWLRNIVVVVLLAGIFLKLWAVGV
jgi:hypothetical protein